MRKIWLFFGVWCLFCMIINPFIFWEMLFKNLFHIDREFILNKNIKIIGSFIFSTAFILFPIFFIIQIKLNKMNKIDKRTFKIYMITFLFFLLNIIYYTFIFLGIDKSVK